MNGRNTPLGCPLTHLLLRLFLAIAGLGLGASRACAAADVEVLRIPDGGVQPQTVVTPEGTVHLMFLRGQEGTSDVWYARRPRDATSFTPPQQVNSQPGSAVAVGTIRGAQFALDTSGNAFVVWNGSGNSSRHTGAPLWFAHRPSGEAKFAPEQDVIRSTAHLDGGGSVASGRPGEVFAVWHSAPPDTTGETNRGVFISISTNAGASFGHEIRIDRPGDGVCACCGLRSLGRPDGTLAVLYRSAGENGEFRDMTLLLRSPEGEIRRLVLDRWSLRSCPMSSASLVWAGHDLLAAWETREEVQLALIDVATGIPTRIDPPPGQGKRKHPSIARNATGELLLAWVEDTGWKRGGSVAWQHYDAQFHPTSTRGRREGLPVWGMASAFASGDRFGVVY